MNNAKTNLPAATGTLARALLELAHESVKQPRKVARVIAHTLIDDLEKWVRREP